MRQQQTIARSVELTGIGLHTGGEVLIRLLPGEMDSGIWFRRTDLSEQPMVRAHVDQVSDTRRCTTIGQGEAAIHTVEHLLAAIFAYRIDNLVVEITSSEPPAAGGCSLAFVELLDRAELVKQQQPAKCVQVTQPIFHSEGDIHLIALPSDSFQVSYTLDYPQIAAIRSQYCSFCIDSDTFKREIAPCRTFALFEELEALRGAGLIKGGSLDDAVVVKGDQIVNEGGLRFHNELARHKALDVIGDLMLVGHEIKAHVVAVRSGHATNVAFARKLARCVS